MGSRLRRTGLTVVAGLLLALLVAPARTQATGARLTTAAIQALDRMGAALGNASIFLTPGTMTVESSSQIRDFTSSYTWTTAQVVALGAGLTGDITVATLPAKTEVVDAKVILTQAFVGALAAQGTITMSGVATANEQFVIGTQTFTWKASRTTTGEVVIGADAAAAVVNIVAAVTADLTTVTAVDGAGDTVVVTAVTAGAGGNALTFSETSTNMAMTGAGTLGGAGATTVGADLASMQVSLGRTAAGYIDYIVALPNPAALDAANTVYGDAAAERGTALTGYDLPSYTGATAIKVHFIAVGVNLDHVTAGTGRVVLTTRLVP